jgi:hypothetical protein
MGKGDIKEIRNLIKRTELLGWEDLIAFQPDNLKILTKQNFERIRNSLIKNNFIAGFHVWEKDGQYFILDGHHRKYVLQSLKAEGFILPEKLPCNIVDVSSKKQAIKFLLTYSSEYAHPDPLGVSEYIHKNEMDFEELDSFVDLRGTDLMMLKLDSVDFEPGNVDDQGKLDQKKPVTCPNCDHEFIP